jgi:predicted Zn-dependent peptidase
MKLFKKYKLKNGLVIATKKTSRKTIVAIIRVHFGAFHEKKGEEGLAHFIEHCLASAGSKFYSVEESDKFRSEFETFNAGTSIDFTQYNVTILPEDLEKFLKFSSSFLFQPEFNPKRVNEERKRILREIIDLKSSSIHQGSKKMENLFYRGHPQGKFIGGKEKIINEVKIDYLKKLHSETYRPNNMDIILIGAVPKNALALTKKYFGNIKSGKNNRLKMPVLKELAKTSKIHEYVPQDKNIDNVEESSASITINFVIRPKTKKEYFALKIISSILGESSNSRLFRKISINQGLAYQVSSDYGDGMEIGQFSVQADVSAKKVKESINLIFEEIKNLKEGGISLEELNLEKKKVKYEYARMFDSGLGWLNLITAVIDKEFELDEFLYGYEKLDLKTINQVAKKYLPESQEKCKHVLWVRDPLNKK